MLFVRRKFLGASIFAVSTVLGEGGGVGAVFTVSVFAFSTVLGEGGGVGDGEGASKSGAISPFDGEGGFEFEPAGVSEEESMQ